MVLKLLIHCGCHKTASTSLQEKILPLCNSYQYIGKSNKALKNNLGGYLGHTLTKFCINASRLTLSQSNQLARLKNELLEIISKINQGREDVFYLYSNESIIQNFSLWNQGSYNENNLPIIPLIELEKLSIISNYSHIFGFQRNIFDYTVSLYIEVQKKRKNLSLPCISLMEWIKFQTKLARTTNRSCYQLYQNKNLYFGNHKRMEGIIQFKDFHSLKKSPFDTLTGLITPRDFRPITFDSSKDTIDSLFRRSHLNTSKEKDILPYILKINSVKSTEDLHKIAIDLIDI